MLISRRCSSGPTPLLQTSAGILAASHNRDNLSKSNCGVRNAPQRSTISRRAVMNLVPGSSVAFCNSTFTAPSPPSEKSSFVAMTPQQTWRLSRCATTLAGRMAWKDEWRQPFASGVYYSLSTPVLGSRGEFMSTLWRKPIFCAASAVLASQCQIRRATVQPTTLRSPYGAPVRVRFKVSRIKRTYIHNASAARSRSAQRNDITV
ncbi:hypothetical protein DAEQUDRAFT_417768 [Daedalea quercina L-15889]|uniref:Uncharacterized protein n=1 Tax=Daedalea quercina L-15889 TaxID=1314783 RepID=A0A165TJK5_9APHY|nr:hypothetical protein DAEQUDRAFT_417768 [Daedalea quercina L-15889]